MLRLEAMSRFLGKPIGDLQLTDIRRENIDQMAADLALLSPEDRLAVRDKMDELLSAADEERRASGRLLDKLRDWQSDVAKAREIGFRDAVETMGRSAYAAAPSAPVALREDARVRLTLTDLALGYFDEKRLGESARVANLTAFGLFDAMTGQRGIGRVTAADVAAFKSELLQRPGKRGGAASRDTVQKNLNLVRAMLKWAAGKQGILSHDPGEKVTLEAAKSMAAKRDAASPKRLAFGTDVLATIFSSPLYTGCGSMARLAEPGTVQGPLSRRFFFLCMLLTGARTEELPGCSVVILDGMPCIDFRATGTKTMASPRIVPILPALRKAGFVGWAERQRRAGIELFRDDKSPGDWSKWSTRYLQQIGVGDALHTPYSLRHNFMSMLRGGGLNSDVVDRVFGHTTAATRGRYDPNDPTASAPEAWLRPDEAKQFLKCVRPPLDMSHLHE